MLLRPLYRDPSHGLSASGRHRDHLLSRQILPRDGFRYLHDLLRSALGNDLTAVGARTGADIHDMVRSQHGILVMLHHDQRITQIPQVLQGIQQLIVVPLMQTDAGLIQNIAYPHQTGADLRRQADSLCFAAGKACRCPGQREIIQSHVHQEAHSGADLLQDALSNEFLLRRQLHLRQEFLQLNN